MIARVSYLKAHIIAQNSFHRANFATPVSRRPDILTGG